MVALLRATNKENEHADIPTPGPMVAGGASSVFWGVEGLDGIGSC